MMDLMIKDYVDPETGLKSTSIGWKEKIGNSWFGDYILIHPRLKSYDCSEVHEAIETLHEQNESIKRYLIG